jgi:hypothetical protein
MDAPGEEPTGYHDSVLGLMGDILPHQYPAVEVPGTAFHLVNNGARVPTTESMATLLPTWDVNTQPALGPFLEHDAETEVVRPRHIQLIPGRYASVIIHRRRVQSKQAYQEIVGAIEAAGEMDACADVNHSWLHTREQTIITWHSPPQASETSSREANTTPVSTTTEPFANARK